MTENTGDIVKATSNKPKTYIYGIIIVALVLYLFFSLEATKSSVEVLRIKNLLHFGMTEAQANYFWGRTPLVLKRNDRTMFPDIPSNLIPKGGKLVRYSGTSPSCYYLVHFNEEGKIDFLYFWLS